MKDTLLMLQKDEFAKLHSSYTYSDIYRAKTFPSPAHPAILSAMGLSVKWADNIGVQWRDILIEPILIGSNDWHLTRRQGYLTKVLTPNLVFANGLTTDWGRCHASAKSIPDLLVLSGEGLWELVYPVVAIIATIIPEYRYEIPGRVLTDGTPANYRDLTRQMGGVNK